MNSENFYHKYNKDKELCSIFCVVCNKVAYSTKENKYMKYQHITNFANLQCLNSSCQNGFSKNYRNFAVANITKKKKKDKVMLSEIAMASTTKYMERFVLN